MRAVLLPPSSAQRPGGSPHPVSTRRRIPGGLLLAFGLLGLIAAIPSSSSADATTNTGEVRTTDYGTTPTTGGAYCWRGYAFKAAQTTVVTHLIGGGNQAYVAGSKEFRGAIYSATMSGDVPVRPAALLRDVRFDGNTVNQAVRLSSDLTLEAGTWYFLAQGAVSGSVLHYYVADLDVGDLILASQRIDGWLPNDGTSSGSAYFWGCDVAPTALVNVAPSSTPNKPALGFRYVSTASLPSVETLAGEPLRGRLTSTGGGPTALYIEYGTSATLSSGTVLNLSEVGYDGPVPYEYGATASGLNPGTTYYYRARAINDAGRVDGSIASFTTPAAPAAPSITSIVGGNTTLTVSFTAQSDITNIRYSTDDGATWTARSPASAASPLLITGLNNGTTYQVRLQAVRDGVLGTQSTAVAGTPNSGEPVDVTATPSPGQVTAAWTAPLAGNPVQYVATATPTGGGTGLSCTTASTSCTITGLTNGVSYTVSVDSDYGGGVLETSAATAAFTPLGWSAGASLPSIVLDRAVDYAGSITFDLATLVDADPSASLAFSVVGSPSLPDALSISGTELTGTVTGASSLGTTSVTLRVSGDGQQDDVTIDVIVVTTGELLTTDYGSAPIFGSAFFWRGYAFQVAEPTVVTHLVGGGRTAYVAGSSEFKGALFSASGGTGASAGHPSAVLAQVRFEAATVNQAVALDTSIVLEPGTWYFLAQGSVAGTVMHWYVDSLGAQDLVDASTRVSAWQPLGAGSDGKGQALIWSGGNHEPTDATIIGRSPGNTDAKPAVGFRYHTFETPPDVTTIPFAEAPAAPLRGRMGPTASGAAYILHGPSSVLGEGSILEFLGVRTPGQEFALEGLTGVTASTYYYRARAINDGGAAQGAIESFTTTVQTIDGLVLPSEMTYGDDAFTLVLGATSTLPVALSASGACASTGMVVTIIGAGSCTLTAVQSGGWDPATSTFWRQRTMTVSQAVTPRSVSLQGGFTVEARSYDGTTSAVIETSALVLGPEVIAGDAVSIATATATFESGDVGASRRALLTDVTLTGSAASRYTVDLSTAPTASAAITAVPLSIASGSFVVADRTYDGTTDATLVEHDMTLSGFLADDSATDLTWDPSAEFATRTVGSGIVVRIVGGEVFGGPKGGNYVLDVDASGTPTATATITPRPVTVVGAASAARPYDGTTSVTVSGAALSNSIAGDAVTLANAATGISASRDAGTRAVTTAMTLTGADAANYVLVAQPALSVTISPLPVGVTMNALPSRPYDGTNALPLAPGSFTVTGTIPGESIAVSGTAQLSSRAAGTRTVALAAPTFTPGGGASLANYALPSSVTGTVTVTPLDVRVVGATVSQRAWDGTTAATVTGATLAGVRAGDAVSLTGATAGVFASAQPGTHAVTYSPTLVGVDSANYRLSVPPLTGTITRASAALRITGGLSQIADGSARQVRAAVSPSTAGRIIIAYPGGTAPSAPGSYRVIVRLESTTHEAAPIEATLTIQDLDALLFPGLVATAGTTSTTTGAGVTSPPSASDDPAVRAARMELLMARMAIRPDGTLALPEIGPVLDGDGATPSLDVRDHLVLVDGEPSTASVTIIEQQRVRIARDDSGGGGFSIDLQAASNDESRTPFPLDVDGTLLLDRGGFVEVGGSGFQPGSTAEVWMFSTATFLGTAIVDDAGTFEGSFPVDELLESGDHTIQLNGIGADSQVRSTSLGVRIDDPEDPARARVIIASSAGSDLGVLTGPFWLLLLAALLGAGVTRWWLAGRRRRDEDEITAERAREDAIR
jgi:hypothetical protein